MGWSAVAREQRGDPRPSSACVRRCRISMRRRLHDPRFLPANLKDQPSKAARCSMRVVTDQGQSCARSWMIFWRKHFYSSHRWWLRFSFKNKFTPEVAHGPRGAGEQTKTRVLLQSSTRWVRSQANCRRLERIRACGKIAQMRCAQFSPILHGRTALTRCHRHGRSSGEAQRRFSQPGGTAGATGMHRKVRHQPSGEGNARAISPSAAQALNV